MEGEDNENNEMKGDDYKCMITCVEKVEIAEDKTSCSEDATEIENSMRKNLSLCIDGRLVLMKKLMVKKAS